MSESNERKPADSEEPAEAAPKHAEQPAAFVPEVSSSSPARRRAAGFAFFTACLASTWFGVLVLIVLLGGVGFEAWPRLDGDFLSSFDSQRKPEDAGVLAGLWGSFWMVLFTIGLAVPVGIGAAIYLEEYADDNWLTKLIRINLANLAGVPSIVYGILGLTAFVRLFGIFEQGSRLTIPPDSLASIPLGAGKALQIAQFELPLPLGACVLAGAMTMSLLILPVIIVASQEALRAVPPSIRHASLALGATRWQTTQRQVLPAAAPGILTGVILSVSRALGETAPLVMIGIPLFTWRTPGGITNVAQAATEPSRLLAVPGGEFTVLPFQIFGWAKQAKPEFYSVAAAGIVVLLVALLTLNSAAILIRNRFQRHAKW